MHIHLHTHTHTSTYNVPVARNRRNFTDGLRRRKRKRPPLYLQINISTWLSPKRLRNLPQYVGISTRHLMFPVLNLRMIWRAAAGEDSLVVSYKTKHTITTWSSNHAPKELRTMSTQHLHLDVYSNFIHNCQNLQTTKMSCSRWMDK